MLAAGMLLIWAGWSVNLWGYCLLRGYNVTLGQLVSPVHPYAGPWPPKLIPATQIWPGGASPAAPGLGAGNPLAAGFVNPGVAQQIQQQTQNQFRKTPG